MRRANPFLFFIILFSLSLSACTSEPLVADPDSSATPTVLPSSTLTAPQPTSTHTPIPSAVPTGEPTETPTATVPSFLEPAGCKKPPEDTSLVKIGDFTINQRTYAMLQYAKEMYRGEIGITGGAITQGSFSDNGPASFGTHLGGGAVDISVIQPGSYTVLYSEIEPLIRALRTAGFAAWLRDWNELPGSGIHIHAIAVGDPELSGAAIEQLTGKAGYFRGYAGYTDSSGEPALDPHGGPLICEWMVESGYSDLRPPEALQPALPQVNWLIRMQAKAESFITTTHADSLQIAQEIDYLKSEGEDPSLMCGPLAAALYQEAGLLPPGSGLWQDLHSYWLADPEHDGRPWNFFPGNDYELFRYREALSGFDFTAWPLRPGDFLYTYAKDNGFEHMFVVTEVDEVGRAYTVANQYRNNGVYLIEKLLLYDPSQPGNGVIYEEWKDPVLGRTGHDGFDVLRVKGLSQPPGSLYEYRVQAGDSILTISAKFYSTPEAIAAANPGMDVSRLKLGSWIWVPVNIMGLDEPVAVSDIPNSSEAGTLERHIRLMLEEAPSGTWGVYLEETNTGQMVSIQGDEPFHPASTIKVPIALAVFAYLDAHPQIKLTDSPAPGERTFEQLLEAMLIKSEEAATASLETFLKNASGLRIQELLKEWGAENTTFEPRKSTPMDLALLWKHLYLGELLSPVSTTTLLEILRTPSSGDEERLGGGLPLEVRELMAHKTGTTFENGLDVVADSGLIVAGDSAYVIVVIGNGVKWVDFEAAKKLISDISLITYEALGDG
ncbi:MAG: LysM peptidoglycan-binding domain-containing protein [Chloroflexi bacterium]|nr:MAG: LysM peptidoglycan-binding domain-containing protein [Chloroflexota bacterium]